MRHSSSDRARLRRLRAQYRKRMVIVAIVFLIIGIILGAFGHMKYAERKAATERRVVEVMVTPTPTPYVEETGIGSFGDVIDDGFVEDEDFGDDDSFDEDAGFGFEDDGASEPAQADAQPQAAQADAEPQAAQADAEPQAAQVDAAQAAPEGDESLAIAMTAPSEAPTATPEPTAAPTPAPTPEPADVVVPFGESYEFSTQIKQDGTARIAASDETFETLNFTMSLKDYMLPSDFAEKWGNVYKLQGNEAGAGFELTLNNYTGSATIIPQNIIKIAFVSESGNTENLGFQLMDAEISGNLDVAVQTNVPKILWKRYTFSNVGEELKYLAVTTYNNGVPQTIRFELKSNVAPTPDPLEQYSTLTRGDKKDAVIDLQKRLVDLGYLSGTADGSYGAKTQEAVRKAQKDFGMEETGTATPEFQVRLFSDEPAEEAPAEEPAAEDAEDADEAGEPEDAEDADADN